MRGDFKESELSQLMRRKATVGDVVSTWQRLGASRPTIAFCVDVAASKELCEEFFAAGIAAKHIDAYTEEGDRAEMFDRLRDGTTSVLYSVAVIGIGFDLPVVSCATPARPTRSLVLHVQQVGRVLRPEPGKTDALISTTRATYCDTAPRSSSSRRLLLALWIGIRTARRANRLLPLSAMLRNREPGQRECHGCGDALRRAPKWIRVDGRLCPVNDDVNANDVRHERV